MKGLRSVVVTLSALAGVSAWPSSGATPAGVAGKLLWQYETGG